MTDSRAAIKTMIRTYMGPAEGRYLDAVANDALDEAVRDHLIKDVDDACRQMVADGKLERIGVIRQRGRMAEPSYRVIDADGELSRQGLEPIPSSPEEIARQVFPLAFRPPMRIYSRWEDAMGEQLRLYDFVRSPGGRAYMRGFEEGMNEKHPPRSQVPDGLLWAIQDDTLSNAEPVYVAHEVCDLIDHARSSFELESVEPHNAFVPAGFCLLAKPLMLHDIPGTDEEMVPVRCIGWDSIHSEDRMIGSFWISFYARVDEVPNRAAPTDWVGYPLFIAHMFQWQWGEKPLGERLAVTAMPDEDPDAAQARALEQGQLVQTLWRLAQQFVPAKQRAPRGLRREALRKMKRKLDDVNLMLLRRESGGGDYEPTDRHMSVSFLVRGYWAIRHTKTGTRQVWVRPHIKGHGPFKQTTRAWEFRR